MKPKLMALNLFLVAAIFAVLWQVRARWSENETLRQKNLNVRMRTATPPPIAPLPKPQADPAVKYEDVAKKNLFSKDRNPDVIIEPPKVEAPKPMPPLPIVYGVMGLPSGTKAIMAEKAGDSSRAIRTGDTIGEFRVLALDTQNVAFEWNGKEVDRKIEDLVDRSRTAAPAAGAAPPQPGPAAPPPTRIEPPSPSGNPSVGVELTATTRACRPGDTSPPGTVVDGFRKVVTQSPFGTVCRWIKQ